MAKRDLSRRQISIAEPGAWLMAVSSAIDLLASLIYYFWRGDGIAYTPGALLVIIATGLFLPAVYTYRGKEYVLFAVGGNAILTPRVSDQIVAFALPDAAS